MRREESKEKYLPVPAATTTRPRPGERGFTLIEMVFSIALLVIAIGAIAAFSGAYLRRSLAFAEAGELDERRAALSALLRADFDRAGASLTRVKEPGAGTESVTLPPNSLYMIADGTFTRTGSGPGSLYAYGQRALGAGSGVFSFMPDASCTSQSCVAGLTRVTDGGAPAAAQSRYFSFFAGDVFVIDNGQVLAATNGSGGIALEAQQDGDAYSIQLEPGHEELAEEMVVAYYRLRGDRKTLLARSPAPMVTYPAQPFIGTGAPGQTVRGLNITGAPIVDITSAPTQIALLPVDGSTRLSGPIRVSPDGQSVLLFGGDPDTDVLTTRADWQDTGAGGTLSVSAPARGQLVGGDYVLLIDFNQQKSALYEVTANDLAGAGALQVVPTSSARRAWGRFYSLPDDFQTDPVSGRNITFPAGSSVVKLAVPVEWLTDAGVVLRREVAGPATVADLGMRKLQFGERIAGGARVYQVDAEVAGEGIESVSDPALAPTTTVALTLTPRALNLTYNNQTP